MNKYISVFFISIFPLMACIEGPTGPQGEQGPPGPARSSSFTTISFAFNDDLYEETEDGNSFMVLEDNRISKINVQGVYGSSINSNGVEIWWPLYNMSSLYSDSILGDYILSNSNSIEDWAVFIYIAEGQIVISDLNKNSRILL